MMKKTAFLPIVLASLLIVSLFITGCSSKSSDTPPPSTKVMLVHASANGPDSLDFLAFNGFTIQNIATDQPYQSTSGYLLASAGTYSLISDTSWQTDANFLTQQIVTLGARDGYSLFVIDSSATAISSFIVTDDLSSPGADSSKVRFLPLSPTAPAVDVLINGAVVFNSRTFYDMTTSSNLSFARIKAGNFDIVVREAGTSNVLKTISAAEFKGNTSYTLFTSGFTGETGKKAFTAKLITQQ